MHLKAFIGPIQARSLVGRFGTDVVQESTAGAHRCYRFRVRREVVNDTEHFKELRRRLGHAAYDALWYRRDLDLSETAVNATDGHEFLVFGSERGKVCTQNCCCFHVNTFSRVRNGRI